MTTRCPALPSLRSWSAADAEDVTLVPRDGSNPIEQLAHRRLALSVGEMPANLIIQLRLWPVTITDWTGPKRGQVYNTLGRAGGKTNEPTRKRLAQGLGYKLEEMNRLIGVARARSPEPSPANQPERSGQGGHSDRARPDAKRRDGLGQIERDTVTHVGRNLGALSASWLLRLCIWDQEIDELATQLGILPAALYHVLSNTNGSPQRDKRAKVAEHLNTLSPEVYVTPRALDQLLDAESAAAVPWTDPPLRPYPAKTRWAEPSPRPRRRDPAPAQLGML